MPAANPFGRGLELIGQIDLTIDSVPCLARFEGERIILAVPDVKSALALRSKLPLALETLRQVEPRLDEAGLELLLEIGGHRVGRLRKGLAPNWLSRRFKLAPFRLEPRGMLAALLSRRTKDSPR